MPSDSSRGQSARRPAKSGPAKGALTPRPATPRRPTSGPPATGRGASGRPGSGAASGGGRAGVSPAVGKGSPPGPDGDLGRPAVPRWASLGSLALAVAGLAVSVYLTIEHFTSSTTLACPETGVINCQRVTTSAQSYLLGVPVAVLGLLFFIVMTGLCLPPLWRSPLAAIRWGRAGFALVGSVMVVYLVYVELFVLDAICLWCTAVHILSVALFAVVALATAGAVDD